MPDPVARLNAALEGRYYVPWVRAALVVGLTSMLACEGVDDVMNPPAPEVSASISSVVISGTQEAVSFEDMWGTVDLTVRVTALHGATISQVVVLVGDAEACSEVFAPQRAGWFDVACEIDTTLFPSGPQVLRVEVWDDRGEVTSSPPLDVVLGHHGLCISRPVLRSECWDWTMVGAPLGFTDNYFIRASPTNPDVWYVSGASGLFVTADAGETWNRPIATLSLVPVEFDPADSCLVYAASLIPLGDTDVMRSLDCGQTWGSILEITPGQAIGSIHVGRFKPGLILVGASVSDTGATDRFYRSDDYGETWTVQEIDGGSRGLIIWDIEEDVNGVIYAGTEIWDHPEPYRAPFFRSMDAGLTWEDVTGSLPWHVVSIQSHPSTATVFALTEGAGLYQTTDAGESWQFVTRRFPIPSVQIVIDPWIPSRIFGTSTVFGLRLGGVYASDDMGSSFHLIGLEGITTDVALADEGRVLLVAGYLSGIWRAEVP